VKRVLVVATILALLFGIWEIYVDAGGADPLLLPPPHAIAKSLFEDRGLLWSNFLVTAKEVLLGILLAAFAALAVATALHFFLSLRLGVYPLLIASQTIPVPLVAPLLVFWLGFGIGPKLLIVGLVSFFSIVVTTLDALSAVDPDLIKLMRTFDAPRRRIFVHVELPSALPGVFTGAKIAVVVSVIGAVFAEWAGSNAGLGFIYQQAIPQLLTARAFAAVFVMSLFAISLFVLLGAIERRALPWASQPTNK
jgi:putative hydroxymethylpyrimidine transport system permease protein